MQTADNPLISIIIPSRNEARDISATLEAVLSLDYEPREILVVDDSTDDTPEIVLRYADRGVRLIHREQNRNGCCGARNLGMQTARGEIVVLMNADDRPQPDFLHRILAHYRDGADYVLVRSEAKNRENIWGRYIHACEKIHLEDDPNHTWSEGFSCRRAAAEAVGYIPGDFPLPFCRDNLLGVRLEQAGFSKVFDLSIPMQHVSPDTLPAYWRNQVWRGSFSAPYAYYFRGMPVPWIALREVAKAARTLLLDLLVVPLLWHGFRCARHGRHPWRDYAGLLWVKVVHDVAITVGSLEGVRRVGRTEGFFSRNRAADNAEAI